MVNCCAINSNRRRIKIIVYHGTQDGAIQMRNDIDYYIRVAAEFGDGKPDFERLRKWYRLFLVPGAGHCPAVPQALPALMNWVENGVAPDTLVQSTLIPRLCPFPQKAIYAGGATNDANSYTCGGDLQTKAVICDGMRTVYKHEKADYVAAFGGYPHEKEDDHETNDGHGRYNPAACNDHPHAPGEKQRDD